MSVKRNEDSGLQTELVPMMPGDKQVKEAEEKSKHAGELNAAEKKLIRQEEDLNKKLLLEREKENFTHIFALKCYNGWLKIYDNSAMILSVWLDGRLGKRYSYADDNGYGSSRAEYGVISIPPSSVGELIRELARAKIPLRVDDVWVLEFELGERLSKDEMVKMLHENELIIDKVNQLVMPRALLPGLRAVVKTLLEFVHTQVMGQRDSIKDIFLNDVERKAVEMNRMVIATARGNIDVLKCLNGIGGFVEGMYESATTMADLRLITAKQYKSFVDLIKRVEAEQGRALKRQAILEAEDKIKESKKRKDEGSR